MGIIFLHKGVLKPSNEKINPRILMEGLKTPTTSFKNQLFGYMV
jgi:hypothetical protein